VVAEVAAGLLTEAIAATGRQLGASIPRPGGRRIAEDLAVARWFDTYRLTERLPVLPELSPADAKQLIEALRQDEIQAVLHELLAARLTDAPEADIRRIRAVFDMTISLTGTSPARFAPALFDYYDGEIAELVGRLEGAEPAVLAQIRSEAVAARMIAVLHAIERHTAALEQRSDLRTETDFLTRYRRHVTEHHGQIVPPDFERRRRVPISDLYVPPAIAQVFDDVESGKPPREIDLWALADVMDRTVLLGDPGGGKTTAANAVMTHLAADANRPVPFMVTLREFASSDPPERSVTGYIEHRLETFYQCQPPPGIVPQLLLTGRALVIFDGLDELLDTSRRAEVAGIIERFAAEYPLAQLLATSRVIGYDQARLDDRQFVCYRIGGFNDRQVSDYVHKWFSQEDNIERNEIERWASAFLDESAANRDLRANPLMLALMCILYRGEGSLPLNRAEVYEQCANLLFRKWDARRRIHLDLRAGHLLEPALRHLAWWLFTRDQAHTAVTERELVDEATAFLYGRGFESADDAREAAVEFVDFCRGRMWVFSDVGTTASGEALYSFTHRTFLEYFAAGQLAYKFDTPERLARNLAPRIARSEWEVVAELAVLIKDHASDRGAQRIYTALMDERRRRSASGRSGVLQFLARCLRSVDPSPQVVRRLTQLVLDHLFAGDPSSEVQYLPLTWLAASCTNYKEIVRDEVDGRIRQLTESGDQRASLDGLSLGLWLYTSIVLDRGNDPHLPFESAVAEFWMQHQDETVHARASAIVSAAETDTEIRCGALQRELISVEQALEMHHGLLSLLQNQPTKVFGILWASRLVGSASSFIAGDLSPDAIEDFATVGRYLTCHPHPPWIAGKAERLSEFDREGDTLPYEPWLQPDPMAYLGIAATVLMAVECEENALFRNQVALGPLNDLQSYIEMRWGAPQGPELPELPLPPALRQTFNNWAENKISFVDQSKS
jgi:hypothetical protein